MRRFFVLIVLLVLFCLGTLPGVLRAQQWNLLATFPSSVSTVYFLDAFGAPDTGFVGCASSATSAGVYRTTNGGANWFACPNTTGLIIRDFTFKNADTGWAIASNTPIVIETTDAGRELDTINGP